MAGIRHASVFHIVQDQARSPQHFAGKNPFKSGYYLSHQWLNYCEMGPMGAYFNIISRPVETDTQAQYYSSSTKPNDVMIPLWLPFAFSHGGV